MNILKTDIQIQQLLQKQYIVLNIILIMFQFVRYAGNDSHLLD